MNTYGIGAVIGFQNPRMIKGKLKTRKGRKLELQKYEEGARSIFLKHLGSEPLIEEHIIQKTVLLILDSGV